MGDRAITAHALVSPCEAQAALLAWFEELGLELAFAEADRLIAWVDDCVDADDEGFPGSPSLVVEARIHRLPDGVQVRCSVRHGEGPLAAALASETDQALQQCLTADGRWVIDGRSDRRP